MKALTICQPYAELILRDEKLVENRTWETAYRGPLLIHAGASRKWLHTYSPLPDRMDWAAIVGWAHLVTILPSDVILDGLQPPRWGYLTRHGHVEGPCCWVLEEVQRFAKPIPYRGQQGLFDVPNEVVREALKGKA
jgi:hypothetical protein